MKKVQQDVMCILLQTLLDNKLITQHIHDKCREKILGTLAWPEFFCYARDTVEDTPFAACAHLSSQPIASEELKYIQYSDSSETRFEPKSCAQSIKKEPSAVSRNVGKEELGGST